MTRILLSGYYGFNNVGDEAILAGIVQAFRELDPAVAFTVVSGTRRQTAERYGVEAVSRGDAGAIWRALGEADLVLSGGGSLLQDVTSLKSLSYYLAILTMAKLRRKPAMIYAQGIGPVRGSVGRTLIRQVCNRLDAITVRDRESAALLARLGVRRPPTDVTADAALVLGAGDPDVGRFILREAGAPAQGPLIGVSIRAWKAGDSRFVPALAGSLDSLARKSGGHAVFFPMQVPGDIQAAGAVRAQMEQASTLLSGPFTYQQVLGLTAAFDLVVALRYHALVFAAMSGTPLVGLSYDPKNDSFLRLIGQGVAGTTDYLDPAEVVEAGLRALAHTPVARAALVSRMAELGALSRQNARIALDLTGEWR